MEELTGDVVLMLLMICITRYTTLFSTAPVAALSGSLMKCDVIVALLAIHINGEFALT